MNEQQPNMNEPQQRRQQVIRLTENECFPVEKTKFTLFDNSFSNTTLPRVIAGIYMYLGIFCNANHLRAYELFNESCREDQSENAYIMICNSLLTGGNKYENPERGAEMLKKLANKTVFAGYNLAYCHEMGRGVKQDYSAAANIYRDIIDRAPVANYRLGLLYYYGYGVRKDYGMASGYFYSAAAGGYKKAMAMLAHMYEFGIGVKKDMTAATKYYVDSGGGVLEKPYGGFEPSELSCGMFIDKIQGRAPYDKDESIALFRSYTNAKEKGDRGLLKKALRKFANAGYCDAGYELANILESEKSIGTLDTLTKNSYIYKHTPSFRRRRELFWHDMEDGNADITDSLINTNADLYQLYQRETVILYERFIDGNIENATGAPAAAAADVAGAADMGAILFEYMTMRYFGVMCEKNKHIAYKMAKSILALAIPAQTMPAQELSAQEMPAHGPDAETGAGMRRRQLAALLLMCREISRKSKGKAVYNELYKLIKLDKIAFDENNDCLTILKCMLTDPHIREEDAVALTKAISSIGDGALASYISGCVYDKAGKHETAIMHYFNYISSEAKAGGSSRSGSGGAAINRIAGNYCERLIEEDVIKTIADEFIPANKYASLGKMTGDYCWSVGDYKDALYAYNSAYASFSDKLNDDSTNVYFSIQRTLFLFYNGGAEALNRIIASQRIKSKNIKDIFSAFASLYDKDPSILYPRFFDTYLKDNEVVKWLYANFLNKEMSNDNVYKIFVDANSSVFNLNGVDHINTFISAAKWYKSNDMDAEYEYWACVLEGVGIEKNETLAIGDETMGIGLTGLANKGHIKSKMALAKIMSDPDSPIYNIERAIKTYITYMEDELADAFSGFAEIGETKQAGLDEDTMSRLRLASVMLHVKEDISNAKAR